MLLQDDTNTLETEIPPESAKTPPPELDIDAWFAQRDEMIARLQERRESLLTEVQETVRKLRVLGIVVDQDDDTEEKYPAKPRVRPKAGSIARRLKRTPQPKSGDSVVTEKTQRVLAAMSKAPEKAADIAKRLGLEYGQVWRALEAAKQAKLVKGVGTAGKDMRWALA